MKLLDLIYVITFKILIIFLLNYNLLNSFIDDEFLIFNGILFQTSIILFLVENLP